MGSESIAERWLPVVGWEGEYEASSEGRIRSLDRTKRTATGVLRTFRGRVLAQWTHPEGYKYVTLPRANQLRVHRLILAAFRGLDAERPDCRHINGRPGDNRVCNLAWCTKVENEADKRRHGTRRLGVAVHNAKLNPRAVRDIRARMSSGERARSVADDYGVTPQAVYLVHKRVTWRHVADDGTTARMARPDPPHEMDP